MNEELLRSTFAPASTATEYLNDVLNVRREWEEAYGSSLATGEAASHAGGVVQLAQGIENSLGGRVNSDGSQSAIPWYAMCEELRVQLDNVTRVSAG